MYVAIEGSMGTGKTTLAKIIGPILNAELVFEIGKSNPFLKHYLDSPDKFVIPMQLYFLLDRFRQHAVEIPSIIAHKPVVSDCLFERDWIFAHLALHGEDIILYEKIYSALVNQVYKPDVVLYLYGSAKFLVKRLKFRGEDTSRQWTQTFITRLNLSFASFFMEYKAAPVITINVDKYDFLSHQSNIERLLISIKTVQKNKKNVIF